MKILITGATGFIGSKVFLKLIEEYCYENIVILTSDDNTKRDEWGNVKVLKSNNYDFSPNFLEVNNCDDIEVIVHVGAWTPKSNNDVNNIEKATCNIINTYKLLMLNFSCLKKIVFTSTLDVYKVDRIITELTLTIPSTVYGWSKLYCEKLIEQFCKKKKIDCQILRLGHVFGEGEEKYRKAMPSMIYDALNGKNLMICGDGKAIRSFIYIDDVADAIVRAIALKGDHIVNVVGNEQITIEGLAKKVVSLANKDGIPVSLDYMKTTVPNKDYIFDNTLLRSLLIKKLTSFDVGLKNEFDYMKHLKQNGKL